MRIKLVICALIYCTSFTSSCSEPDTPLVDSSELAFPEDTKTQPLFRIVQNDSIGYIDVEGNVVIKPMFLAGGEFSNGRAAVRKNGSYGFIDGTGTYRIQPVYDYASAFVNGYAFVYKDSKPMIINKNGKVVLPAVYESLTWLDSSRALIKTLSGRSGVIDFLTLKLVIDTAFTSISEFTSGVAVVTEAILWGEREGQKRFGVIDANGKFVVPFGRYLSINNFVQGFAVVEIFDPKHEDRQTLGVIDTGGKLIFRRRIEGNAYVGGDFYDGYAKIGLYKSWIPEEKGVLSTSGKNYEGYIDLKGDIVLNDTNIRFVQDFANARAFVQKEQGTYQLVDRSFKRIGSGSYTSILNDSFFNGFAIVTANGRFGVIDTTGNFVLQPRFHSIDDIGIIDDYFFFTTTYSDDRLFGISDLKGRELVKPVMSDFDRSGFVNGLIKAVIDGRLSYVNKNGKIVWQEVRKDTPDLKRLNIDYMNRGYMYAYSTPKKEDMEMGGGWATSSNRSHKIQQLRFPKNELTITIDTTRIDTFSNRYFGHKLYISNTTGDTVNFNAQDSRLSLKLQAQDLKGTWRDIEYLPNSWCGNSYHTIQLEPDFYFAFTIPDYQGEIQTKLRAELRVINGKNRNNENVIYSNVINASVNPGQFWHKATYYPGSLMDPYND